MTNRARYLLDLRPGSLSLGAWQAALLGLSHAGCQGHSKALHGCVIATIDATALIEFGLFWCQMILRIAVSVSLCLVFSTWVRARYGTSGS